MDDVAYAVGKARQHQKLEQQCYTREMANKRKTDYFVCFLLWQFLSDNIYSGNSSFCTVPRTFTKIWD